MEPATQQQVGKSLVRATSETFDKDYTKEEKQAALGRHTVDTLNISKNYLTGMAALGGIAGVTLAGRLGDYSLDPVIAGVTGATMGLVGAIANARPMRPSEHASYQLEQTKAAKAYLLEHPLDRPDYQCVGDDYFVIRLMASRYQESCQSLWLLWAAVYSPSPKTLEALMNDLHNELTNKHGIDREYIPDVVSNMGNIKSLEDAKELPEFKRLMSRFSVPVKDQEDISKLMFVLDRLTEKFLGKSQGRSPSELYQDLCKNKYSEYKIRLEKDRIRLEKDIRILQAMERNLPASVSAPSATGTEV